jgi:hypothetical protein
MTTPGWRFPKLTAALKSLAWIDGAAPAGDIGRQVADAGALIGDEREGVIRAAAANLSGTLSWVLQPSQITQA